MSEINMSAGPTPPLTPGGPSASLQSSDPFQFSDLTAPPVTLELFHVFLTLYVSNLPFFSLVDISHWT